MNAQERSAARVLAEHYVDVFPSEVATELERWPAPRAASFLESLQPKAAVHVAQSLRIDSTGEILEKLSPSGAAQLLGEMDPGRAAPVLARLEPELQESVLAGFEPAASEELRALMTYPPGSAGTMMDVEVTTFRPTSSVGQVLTRLRSLRAKRVQYVFVVDDEDRLVGSVPLQEVALAEPSAQLQTLTAGAGLPPSVRAVSSQEEVAEILEASRVTALPVVDVDGRLIGVIRSEALFRAAEAAATADLQAMVGASREERALSSVGFAIRKRLPWLQINLGTAFLAAAVVGFFESTIAEFTALAVLLPVVAGQSGNTGAQALAVTMRGLALREVRLRHWARIAFKEAGVGAVNGIAVAVVTGLGVLWWSNSWGLAGVISISMVLSMTIASLAGASVPMVLTILKQDPAQASSIILTTVTDVMGFVSFLGLATLAKGFLVGS